MSENADVKDLLGKTLLSVVQKDNDEVLFQCDDGAEYKMYHSQSCCESVTIEDVCGDLKDLVGSPLLQAEEVSNDDQGKPGDECYTWTFYKFGTAKGRVTIRWYGTSNGYYSESVDFEKVTHVQA